MAVIASAMDLAERPRAAQPQATTVKPEVTTEDTTNRILSLPVEEKCAKRKCKIHKYPCHPSIYPNVRITRYTTLVKLSFEFKNVKIGSEIA